MKRKFVIGCIGIPFLILVCLLLFAEWVWGGSIKPSLDTQYIPTAEYLFEHPQPTPSFLSIYPEPGKVIYRPHEGIYITVLGMNRDDVAQWTRLRLNENRIPRASIGITFLYGLWPLKKNVNNVVDLVFTQIDKINLGFRLFQIQVGSSFNDFLNPDPKLSYEWAYRVE